MFTSTPETPSVCVTPFLVPEHGIFDGQFLITKVSIKPFLKSDGSVFYIFEVESTDGPNLGSFTKYFVALGRSVPS